jgi:hypothetical protein
MNENTSLDVDRLLVLIGINGSEFKEVYLTSEQRQMVLQCLKNIFSPGKIKIVNQELKITTNEKQQ